MRLSLPRALRLLLVLVPALAAGRARAGGLQVTPVSVELTGGARTALVEVRNGGTRPARFEITTFAWGERPDGQMDLVPARDVVAYPPVFALGPGEARNVRIGTTAAPADRERTWRVFIAELPEAQEPGGARLQVLTRVGVPVFLAPAGAPLARGEIADVSVARGEVGFVVRNTGNVHFRTLAAEITVLDAAGQGLFSHTFDGWYVLAGGERRYRIELPRNRCAAARSVVLRAPVGAPSLQGPIEARYAVPNDACGP